MAEENPYSGKTLAELKSVDWKKLPLDKLQMFEAAVKSLADHEGRNIPTYGLWLGVVRRKTRLEVERYNAIGQILISLRQLCSLRGFFFSCFLIFRSPIFLIP